MTKQQKGRLLYILFDFLMALVAWVCFYVFRKLNIEDKPYEPEVFLQDTNLLYGIIVIPIGWVMLYAIFESYKDIYRLSRLSTFANTFFLSFFGVTFLFFSLILDDVVYNYRTYYISFLALLGFHFTLTVLARMIILTRAHEQIKRGIVGFNTLIIGGNNNAVELYQEITGQRHSLGYIFKGFIDTNGLSTNELEENLPNLGKLDNLSQVIKEYEIQEVIIAIETSEHNRLQDILNVLYDFEKLIIKIIPDMYDILLGSVKMTQIYGALLIEIQQGLMTTWQRMLKRTFDVVVSLIMLLLLSPMYLYAAIMVRLSSKGPIFFRQERIGIYGRPFKIIKFRSMYTDAEKHGPQLAKDDDDRCTPWGKVMRKWRIDELPQFWNVLIGDMSIVGPRPERQFYIDQIVKRAPHYKQLLKVRPGITSWGQVKYGYASNVEEMIQRLKYDILYIENMSFTLDLKIMIYTVLVIIQGRGK